MGSQLRTADLIVLLVYMAGVFALGCWFAQERKATRVHGGGTIDAWLGCRDVDLWHLRQ